MADGSIPLSFRRAGPSAPRTLDRQARTVEVIAATTTPVERSASNPAGEWERWTEIIDIASADTARFVGGPVLLDHRNETGALVGSVQSVRVVGNELLATIRFASNDRGEEVLELVAAGHLTGVSVGYRITGFRREGRKFTVSVQILELSLTPIPADANARVRSAVSETRASEEGRMPHDTTTAPAEGATTATAPEGEVRAETIRRLYTRHNLDMRRAEVMIETGATVEQARADVLEELARADNAGPTTEAPTRATVGHSWDAGPGLQSRYADALATLVGREFGLNHEPGPGRDFLRPTVAETKLGMARNAARLRGDLMLSDADALTHWMRGSGGMVSTSDFPLVAGPATTLLVARVLEQQPIGLREVVHVIPASDWRARSHYSWSGANRFQVVNEGGEPKHLVIDENGEVIDAPARMAGFYRASDEFMRNSASTIALEVALGRAMIEGAQETLRATIASKIVAPGNLSDGLPVFDASRGNLAAGPAAITVSSSSAARVGLERAVDSQGVRRPIEPGIILVAPEQRTEAEQLVAEIAAAQTSEVNPFAGRLRVISDAALSGEAGAHWYVLGDPSRFDGLALIMLDDMMSPLIEAQPAWLQFGWEWRAQWPMACSWVRPSWFRTEIPGAG